MSTNACLGQMKEEGEGEGQEKGGAYAKGGGERGRRRLEEEDAHLYWGGVGVAQRLTGSDQRARQVEVGEALSREASAVGGLSKVARLWGSGTRPCCSPTHSCSLRSARVASVASMHLHTIAAQTT